MRWPLAIVALGALTLSVHAETVFDLPQMGEPADASMSPAEEKKLGGQVVTQLYAREYMLEDAEIGEYVSTLGFKIAAASETAPPPLTLFVIRDPRINAFALPGGFIGVNAGLITSAQNESEVAGVLSHEAAHVTQRHIARSIEGTEVATIATWAAVIAAIIAGSADPDVVLAALSVGQAANYQRQVNFTRAHELEADRIGIRTLASAGFDSGAMATFFMRLEQTSRLYGSQVPEFLRTHPVNTTRISEARSRAAGLGTRKKNAESPDFPVIQARTRVLIAATPSEAVEYFSGQLGGGRVSPAHQYGLALAYTQLGDYRRAESTLAPALTALPRQVNIALLGAQIQLGLGRTEPALAQFRSILKSNPRYAPAILETAKALINSNKAEAAREVLISHDQTLGTRMETYSLLAQAARALKNTPEAQYQTANYLVARGDAGGALAALDAGLGLSSLKDTERARMKSRRDEIRALLPENWRPRQPGRSR